MSIQWGNLQANWKVLKTKLQHPHSIKWHSQSIMSHFLFAYTYIQYYVSEVCYWAGCECMHKVCYLQLHRWGKTEKHGPNWGWTVDLYSNGLVWSDKTSADLVACCSCPETANSSINQVEWISQWKLTAHVHVSRSCVLEAGTSNHIKKHETHSTLVVYLHSHTLYTLAVVLPKRMRIPHMCTCPLLAVYFVTH